jgi:serine/threonine protein kinase
MTAGDPPDSPIAKGKTVVGIPSFAEPVDGESVTVVASSSDPTRPMTLSDDFEPSRWTLTPGALIDNCYRITRELGRGAMGVVVLAHDERLDRDVAIKVIRADAADANFSALFQLEARAMARVNHRNVVPIYASGEHDGVPYFVMELVRGKTLEEYLEAENRRIAIDTALQILTQVCDGVAAIHAANTFHRDIKPSNILIGVDLRVAVTDFGVALMADGQKSRRPEMAGTPTYMAPEVAFPVPEQQPTAAMDVYSLACVAFELFTGRPPFIAETQNQVILKHATVPPTAPTEFRSDLPAAFDRVILDALAKDPAARTQTIEAFRQGVLQASRKSADPVRILIAEDDVDFRDVLEAALKQEFEDAEIEAVPNGLLALQALGARPVSVAILDLNMPGMDGMEVTKRIRALDESRGMPIIVLTGSGGPAEWRELASIGADRFLVKPVSLPDLVAAVRHSLLERAKN